MISRTKAEDLYFQKAQLEQRIRQLQKSARQTEKVLVTSYTKSSSPQKFRQLRQYHRQELKQTRSELGAVGRKLQALQQLSTPSLTPWAVVLGIMMVAIVIVVYLSPQITSSATANASTEATESTTTSTPAIATAATTAIATAITGSIAGVSTETETAKTGTATTTMIPTPILIEGKTQYTAAEQPTFTIKLAEQQGNKITGKFIGLSSASLVTASIIDPQGIERTVPTEISNSNGVLQIAVEKNRNFRPGLYKLRIKTNLHNQDYVQEQDFRWGVLAINFDKTIYQAGEEAFIGMAVLNDRGRMVCDAEVTLEIISPDNEKTVLQIADGKIKVSPECQVYGVTNLPDYYTSYKVGAEGKYKVALTAVTANGVRTLTEELVGGEVPFDVQRTGPTRIYPPAKYIMNLGITPAASYSGSIVESVPASFTVEPSPDFTIKVEGNTKHLTWNDEFIAGKTKQLSYSFIAPTLSPEFYLLGPLTINSWEESRFWQIAADLLPTQGAVILNSTNEQRNTTQSNLTVNQQSVTSGQNIKNITNWRINGTSIMLINMPFERINLTTTNNAWDYSGYGYNGTEVGGIAWNYTAGFDGRGAYEFDGTNDLIILPNSFNAQPSTVLTITAWIFPKNCTNNMRIVTKSVQAGGPGQQTGAIIFDTNAGGQQAAGCGINFAFTNNTGTQESTPPSGRVLNPREWYFVAVTSNNTNRTTYVNGDIIASNYSNSVEIPASPSYNWTVGEVEAYSGSPMQPSTVFNGTIDDLRIYNRSLSHEQIIALWKNRTDLIVSEELRPEQNWSAVVTLNNGTGDGQSVLSNALRIVANNTPTHDKAPVLNTTDLTKNDTTTNLTLYVFTRDHDFDSLKNITNWLVNGTPIAQLNMPFERINGTSSNNARDYSGNGYNGSEVGGVVWNATGGFDGRGAYTFDGTDDFINVSNSSAATPNLNPPTALSVAAWTNPIAGEEPRAIVARWNDNAFTYMLEIVRATPTFRVRSGGTEAIRTGTTTVTNNTWYHLVGTYNTTDLLLYVNGVAEGTLSGTLPTTLPATTESTYIGRRGNDTQAFFRGTLDEIQIFNRSLTAQQILAWYNNKTTILVSQELSSPQNWTALVYPNDGSVDGAHGISNQQIIRNNRAPTQTAPILNTTSPTNNNTRTNLTLYINASDNDGDIVKNITNWRRNGTSITFINMPFEQINGTTSNNAWDYSGYYYNGTEVGGILWNATGGYDGWGAYEFDATNDIIVLPNSFDAQPTIALTITAWIFPRNCTNPGRIVTKGATGQAQTGQIILDTSAGQQGNACGLSLIIQNSSAGEATPSTGRIMDPRAWYFVAATFNNSNMTTYLNGAMQTSNYTNSLVIPASASLNWTIGEIEGASVGFGASTFFNGTIDEVRIYNRSLTPDQILALYNNRTDIIVSAELRPSQNWTADVTVNDRKSDGTTARSNQVIIAGNTLPTAPGYIEIGYQNATSITNRTPIFVWYNSTDADSDIISYHLQVDDNSAFNNPEINYSALWTSIPAGSNTTYFSTTGTTELSLDVTYFWRVRANDSSGFGDFSNTRNFTVTSLLSLTFTNSGVAFGSLGQGGNASTDDGDPPPIRGENRGNMQGNISINATPLLVRVPINRSNYQFKIRANESGAFDSVLSQGTYANLSNRTTQAHVVNLSWRDAKANDFLVDINLTLPFDEPAGFKQSIITFTMSGNE